MFDASVRQIEDGRWIAEIAQNGVLIITVDWAPGVGGFVAMSESEAKSVADDVLNRVRQEAGTA